MANIYLEFETEPLPRPFRALCNLDLEPRACALGCPAGPLRGPWFCNRNQPGYVVATKFTMRPSRNQIKKPITCTYFVDVDVHVLVDGCCHLQICFQKVERFSAW